MAGGATRLNEIAPKSNLETGSYSKNLNVLVALGIIEKNQPVAYFQKSGMPLNLRCSPLITRIGSTHNESIILSKYSAASGVAFL